MIKDRSQARFWEDIWLGNTPLREQYPQIYNIARGNQDTVEAVLSASPPNASWWRDHFGDKLVMWNNLLSRLTAVVLSQEEDEFIWTIDQKGEFSVKTHYLGLIHETIPNTNKRLWKLRTPLKIKVFLCFL